MKEATQEQKTTLSGYRWIITRDRFYINSGCCRWEFVDKKNPLNKHSVIKEYNKSIQQGWKRAVCHFNGWVENTLNKERGTK